MTTHSKVKEMYLMKTKCKFSYVAFLFLQSSKQTLLLRNPCNTQIRYSYSQAFSLFSSLDNTT